jgi:hypothetical protein
VAVKHMRSRNKGWERQSRQAQPKCKQSDAGLGASGLQPKTAGGLRWLLPHHVRYDDSGENVNVPYGSVRASKFRGPGLSRLPSAVRSESAS